MQFTNLPKKPILKQILISSFDKLEDIGVLSKLNPFYVAKEINVIWSEVDNIEQ